MDLTYGYEVSKNDPIVGALDEAADMLAQAVFPGAMAVNALPALQYLPEWLPGMHFKAYGHKCRLLMDEIMQVPLASVQRKMAAGTARPSNIGSMLKENNGDLDGMDLVKKVGLSMYAAMTDTTSMGITVAVHAFLLHPDVQRRAQDELDVVVGRDRLPSFADRDTLPYVNAIVREVVRWKPVLPLGFPRIAIQDDIYDGKLIPKGAMILPNAWAMLHDAEKYPKPEIFSPNRFLNKDGELIDDEVTPAFGFGRRICPGRHAAMSSLFINIACMLSVFSLQPKKNERGEDLPVNVTYADGLSSRPSSFECKFVPRDQAADNVLGKFADDDAHPAKVPAPDTMT
ncbi:hypothetical protein EWM64_g2260 [Hericium alpestre]|uniref:Cytochrome P450 n=1 Tax=Hericium alpestre TaxID=135208 RepID=A0A4Z0A678_9AGAM|nr:hypothetical protein EWM64_g2260 [Hericium alpestre]